MKTEPAAGCVTSEFPELNGYTIFEASGWSRDEVTCHCCGKSDLHKFCYVQLIHWGDDWQKTTRFNYKVCPECRSDHDMLLQLFASDKVIGILDVVPQTIVFGSKNPTQP